MKRICAGLLALLLCLTAWSVTALASDTTLDVRYIPITEDGFIADTMDGVDAIYNLWGGPDCADLVIRYYDAVFGVDVQLGGVPVVTGGEGWFEETDVPQRGDILYASAAARGNSTHYALCKFVDEAAGTVTLFEQNWVWNGQAGVDRVIPLDSCYTYYTLRGVDTDRPRNDGGSGAVREEPSDSWMDGGNFDLSALGTPSGWAQSYVERAADYGVLSGLTSGYQSAVTRGEFAQLVVNAAEILTGEYYYGSVSDRAEALGLMFGDGKGNFRLNDSLTRQEAAVICMRLMRLAGAAPEADTRVLSDYGDTAEIAGWAREGVGIMTQMGLMSGTGKGFSPKATITTEQAITLFVRVYEKTIY